jgi:hypothetical protein
VIRGRDSGEAGTDDENVEVLGPDRGGGGGWLQRFNDEATS